MNEPIIATIGEYTDYGTYVWVDYGDGEELARSLEDAGMKVIRVRSQTEQELNAQKPHEQSNPKEDRKNSE